MSSTLSDAVALEKSIWRFFGASPNSLACPPGTKQRESRLGSVSWYTARTCYSLDWKPNCCDLCPGLDSHAALAVMRYLNTLTDMGHTIVSSIHQPRQEIFGSFDKVFTSIRLKRHRTNYPTLMRCLKSD